MTAQFPLLQQHVLVIMQQRGSPPSETFTWPSRSKPGPKQNTDHHKHTKQTLRTVENIQDAVVRLHLPQTNNCICHFHRRLGLSIVRASQDAELNKAPVPTGPRSLVVPGGGPAVWPRRTHPTGWRHPLHGVALLHGDAHGRGGHHFLGDVHSEDAVVQEGSHCLGLGALGQAKAARELLRVLLGADLFRGRGTTGAWARGQSLDQARIVNPSGCPTDQSCK